MESRKTPAISFALLVTACLTFHSPASAQDPGITTYQYRRVPEDKISEFVKHETTYWSKVVQKAVDEKKLTFWALLEKIGGYDLPNSSNFLFINTYPDADQIGDVWGKAEAITCKRVSQRSANDPSYDVPTPGQAIYSGGNEKSIGLGNRLAQELDQRIADADIADAGGSEKQLHHSFLKL